MNAALNPRASSAFSVFPLTRAHMVLPRSVLSVPTPDTKQKVICGFAATIARAAASVSS